MWRAILQPWLEIDVYFKQLQQVSKILSIGCGQKGLCIWLGSDLPAEDRPDSVWMRLVRDNDTDVCLWRKNSCDFHDKMKVYTRFHSDRMCFVLLRCKNSSCDSSVSWKVQNGGSATRKLRTNLLQTKNVLQKKLFFVGISVNVIGVFFLLVFPYSVTKQLMDSHSQSIHGHTGRCKIKAQYSAQTVCCI